MRIVAGRHKGRVLLAPVGRNTRPTADRAREALFNILAHDEPPLEGASVLDAFAGSGALGFEALSRGAERVTFLETDGSAFSVICANAKKMGVEKQVSIQRIDATRPPKAARPCRFVLMDPPYKSGLAAPALQALNAQGWIAPDAMIVVEVAAGEAFAPPIDGLVIVDERKYGAARLVFLRFALCLEDSSAPAPVDR
ncbi:16S rRNA (guanine(966)-N(2))-methyltransferase RsmD [Telmatospirillum sp.]|uniref:16S rRNA (guanine(966)-N(2))-methyltransferase RsmD n=1 Tax=Telmatospirillum sp. TaxID=2079197 RepID=UPI0028457BC4|nr:16S rRNA (guanine(966)-N(2))-methyltransferase RsmD [Telmatospirillum sp.]MDR3435586.1 16S rRNA (guanine(966)-N(2))-methyltransferase RsmD [Telmatospirillum sp.]